MQYKIYNTYVFLYSHPTEQRPVLKAAEITLEALLREPEEFLPHHIVHYTVNLSPERQLSIQEISRMLNTCPFLVERLIRALNFSSVNGRSPILNRTIVQKLIRVFNSTIDVRCLILFKILDENNDQYVRRSELSRFYRAYLESVKLFDANQIPCVIGILLKRFGLTTVSLYCSLAQDI